MSTQSDIFSVQSLSRVQLFATSWSAAHQVSPSFTISQFSQTHIHWVGDAIQPFHPLSPPSPPALNLPQHQGLTYNRLTFIRRNLMVTQESIWVVITEKSSNLFILRFPGTSLIVQQLSFQSPNAEGLGSIPSRGTGSHMPQLSWNAATEKRKDIKCCNEDRTCCS